MYECEREMHRHMDDVEFELDKKYGPLKAAGLSVDFMEGRLTAHRAEAIERHAAEIEIAFRGPDTETPIEAWLEFNPQKEPLTEQQCRVAQAVSKFLPGETEFEEFFKPEPPLSPNRPQIA